MSSPQPVCFRLADFIAGHRAAIVSAWEDFARGNWPVELPDTMELRDNAETILMAFAADMKSTPADLAHDRGSGRDLKERMLLAGETLRHVRERMASGFDLVLMVAEFRALRASVMRVWLASHPLAHTEQAIDLMHFHEAIDGLVSMVVEAHSARVEQGRRLFMGIIGHDLRQPLCSVRLLVSALIRAGNTIESPPVLAKIQQSVESMDALVRDLVDLSSTRLGVKMTVYRQSLDLAELAGETMIQAESANPRLIFKLVTEGDLSGEWDGLRLRQLLGNLLENAARYSSDAGEVELILNPTADDEGVEIRVRNQGRLIPPDVLEVLFEPMKRYARADADSRVGSVGLGLYICREIVSAHEGEIGVESTEDGTTTVTIVLPRVASHIATKEVEDDR